MKVAGIMSGTSLDGIDVAIVEITGRGWSKKVRTLGFHSIPYPAPVRRALLGVSNAETHTAHISRLNFVLGELYSEALYATCGLTGIDVSSLDLIGCHGQTIFHEGRPIAYLSRRVASTLQIGEAAVIAELARVPVVSDFRTRDLAAGGTGAPLVPYVDYLLFRHRKRGRVALNLGGIGNLTAIPPGAPPAEVTAFDTGPGNMVIDQLVERHTRGRLRFDQNGRLAASAQPDEPLLAQLLEDRYYRAKPPKSAGREEYGAEFIARLVAAGRPLPVLIATATELTARTVAAGIERFVAPRMPPDDLIVSGGGAHNPVILAALGRLLPGTRVTTSAEFGVSVDAKEAVAFAILAHETWRGRPSNLPSATGAIRPVVLGKISR